MALIPRFCDQIQNECVCISLNNNSANSSPTIFPGHEPRGAKRLTFHLPEHVSQTIYWTLIKIETQRGTIFLIYDPVIECDCVSLFLYRRADKMYRNLQSDT